MTESTLNPAPGVAMGKDNPKSDDELIASLMEALGSVLDRASVYAVMSERAYLKEIEADPRDIDAAPLMAQQGCQFAMQAKALIDEFLDGPRDAGNGYSEHLIQFGASLMNGFSGYASTVARAATDEAIMRAGGRKDA